MGLYLNTSNESFKLSINDNIYVDKTNIIHELNKLIGKRNRYICISRPRRFGKTMIAEMLNAYYSKDNNSKNLFKKYKIYNDASFNKYLNKYDVIHLNIQNFITKSKNCDELVEKIEKAIKSDLASKYREVNLRQDLDVILELLYKENKDCNGFIFIIDEWDAIFRDKNFSSKNDYEKYLDFLRLIFKDRIYVKLAYMTGILPIKKYGTHSALNMFEENSMIELGKYGEYFGFTEKEVEALCKNKIKFKKDLKKWYDGYLYKRSTNLYNPRSVVSAIEKKSINNYWARTETFETLKYYIDLNFDDLKTAVVDMMLAKKVVINTDSFQNDMSSFQNRDDVLTLLVHLGYLTYDIKNKTVSIPNLEVKDEFKIAIKNGDRKELIDAIKLSDKLLNATINSDEDEVAKIIDSIHMSTTDLKHYNNETALSNVIKMGYYTAVDKYDIYYEIETGYGFADIVFVPNDKNKKLPAFIVELKYNKKPEIAMSQIKNNKYYNKFKKYKNNMLLVGISYDKKTKKHMCKIEKYADFIGKLLVFGNFLYLH